jgi:hypothetical protein
MSTDLVSEDSCWRSLQLLGDHENRALSTNRLSPYELGFFTPTHSYYAYTLLSDPDPSFNAIQPLLAVYRSKYEAVLQAPGTQEKVQIMLKYSHRYKKMISSFSVKYALVDPDSTLQYKDYTHTRSSSSTPPKHQPSLSIRLQGPSRFAFAFGNL